MLLGCDVSSWNTEAQLNAVPAERKQFLMMKVTESLNYLNPELHWQNIYANTHSFRKGFYHMLHPTIDAVEQADYFLSHFIHVKRCMIGVDLEPIKGVAWGTPLQRAYALLNFASRIKTRTGASTLIYGPPDSFAEIREGVPMSVWRQVISYPLWDPYLDEDPGRIPESSMNDWPVWTMQQNAWAPYVDRDVFNGTLATWDKLAIR
jgi:GH25 family lysozyme M1 (1,4-beta-N-acetylmuramidase)